MVLDINLFRAEKGGNPDLIRESERKRGHDGSLVDKVISLDEQWPQYDTEQMSKQMAINQKEIATKKKQYDVQAGENADDLVAQNKAIQAEQGKLQKQADELKEELNKVLRQVGNIVHPSVPVSLDEKDNVTTKTWGDLSACPQGDVLHHHEILSMLDAFDQERGTNVAGHRGYFLKGVGVLLNQALINYGICFLMNKGYTPIQPPFMMNKDVMSETAQLADFDEQLYKVIGGNQDQYLIATSEQPLSAFHRKEWLDNKDLPIKYAGISSCFRKEAGAYGKETWGIFRVHQFEKIEQFQYVEPEKSWDAHEEMITNSEEFYQSLKLPYRVVMIVSGELNASTSKKYDLEAWFPGYDTYRELVSCSNCTDYQARSMEVRAGLTKKQNDREKRYCHMLNSTLCATERAMCCVVENYQTKDGVIVPEVLRPYMGGRTFLPFTKAKPTAPPAATAPDAK